MRVDRKAFTRSIVETIFDEIRKAKLLIFVATDMNPNVTSKISKSKYCSEASCIAFVGYLVRLVGKKARGVPEQLAAHATSRNLRKVLDLYQGAPEIHIVVPHPVNARQLRHQTCITRNVRQVATSTQSKLP